jgi:hypothetical protein
VPRDFAEVTAALRDPGRRVQLVVCTHDTTDSQRFAAATVDIPPLASRAVEIGRVIDEYGGDAVVALGANVTFTSADREWVREHSAGSLPEIEKGTLRLIALREGGSIVRAASILEMSHSSLTEWIGRRRLPSRLRSDPE